MPQHCTCRWTAQEVTDTRFHTPILHQYIKPFTNNVGPYCTLHTAVPAISRNETSLNVGLSRVAVLLALLFHRLEGTFHDSTTQTTNIRSTLHSQQKWVSFSCIGLAAIKSMTSPTVTQPDRMVVFMVGLHVLDSESAMVAGTGTCKF